MKIEYIIIICTVVFVVIFGSILLYLLVKPHNIQTDKTTSQHSDFYRPLEQSNSSNDNHVVYQDEKPQKKKNNKLEEIIELSEIEKQNAHILQTALNLNKISNSPMQLKENATKMIFMLFGNMHASVQNELQIYDNVGKLIIKMKFLPDVNKVIINDWHETENVFLATQQWPKCIRFSFTENIIRMNNNMVYEFPDDDYRIYRYMKIEAKGIKEIQLLSINETNITAEQVIKKH